MSILLAFYLAAAAAATTPVPAPNHSDHARALRLCLQHGGVRRYTEDSVRCWDGTFYRVRGRV